LIYQRKELKNERSIKKLQLEKRILFQKKKLKTYNEDCCWEWVFRRSFGDLGSHKYIDLNRQLGELKGDKMCVKG
jgi:hypothetical protein